MADTFTTDHEEVQTWIENHGGFPARIKGVVNEESDEFDSLDAIEIAFDSDTPDLDRVEWADFFDWMEHHNLALRYNDKAQPGLGMFEFVDRTLVTAELLQSEDLPDTGDEEVLLENIIPDADP